CVSLSLLYSCSVSLSTRVCFLFFFYSYGPHRDLHSFPTRRSSDLDRLPGRPRAAGSRRARHPPRLVRRAARTSPSERTARETVRDRKSTRLNSSHGSISYAVFCLKKKKKKHKHIKTTTITTRIHQH